MEMKINRTHNKNRIWPRRGLAGILAMVLLLGLLPVRTFQADAATGESSWAMPYMEQLVDWGVMRGDINGNLNPNRNITRAEFITLINRAYGYTDVGPIPFTDVTGNEWYADDIAIAYKVGYFKGVTDVSAGPTKPLVREQAAMLLARNMMLQENPGEVLDFTDGRTFSAWSRGIIRAISDMGIVTGYPDGTFRPKNNITRGEASTMLVRAIGELVNTPGVHSLGSVYGNVTVNKSGITLENTVIVGNLYLTGGIGLGDVLLENVTVLGQIIVSGAGESSSGQSSVIMRNVSAHEMIVDSINDQFVTVRAEGNTDIAKTSVRTNAYVEDSSTAGHGLSRVELDAEKGTKFQLAGNIKELVNLTPASSLQMAQGSAQKVTIDEHAVGSTVTIDRGARIVELNLDVTTAVSGNGDIDALNVGASGCTVAMLPDQISIRPGLTATIAGTSMDSVTAAEWSSEPRLLAGYPRAKNVSTSSATMVFSTNKAGTVYWVVTALADGSVDEETVIAPPANAAKIVASGNLKAAASSQEYTAEVKKLTSDGSYYLTAIMVDARGVRSPLKVAAFGVPDETVPAFATGYPRMSKTTTDTAQVTIMPNKSCQLYYALLPAGSTAPTALEFKANAISGNLGYGVVDVVKNVTLPINVNDVILEEQTSYDLYLWMTDYDGAKSSRVTKLNFTTADQTPPVVVDIMQTDSLAASAVVTYALNEPGTLYWAIVAEGNDSFMNYDLNSTEAKVKVESGVGALKKGSSSAAKADTDYKITISGLNTKTTNTTSYTLYYVAKDKQGNYSDQVRMLNIRTLDTEKPTVKQEFTSYNGEDTGAPMPDTDIRLVFSESVKGGTGTDKLFLSLYAAVGSAVSETEKNAAREKLAAALRAHITFYQISTNGSTAPVDERTWTPGDPEHRNTPWTIDWRYATIAMESNGSMVITLPTTDDTLGNYSALNMESGATYYFRLESIYDNALTPNAMGNIDLPQFRTVYAQISLSNTDMGLIDDENSPYNGTRLDMCLNVEPISTSKVADTECWDMILWSDTSVSLQLYRRVMRGTTEVSGWERVGGDAAITVSSTGTGFSGISLRGDVITQTGQTTFPKLKSGLAGALDEGYTYQYGIHFTQVGDLSDDDYDSWGNLVTMRFAIIAGGSGNLGTVAGNVNRNYDSLIREGSVTSIGLAYSPSGLTDILTLRRQFTDRSVPAFRTDSPLFNAGSSTLNMRLALDREGTIYYVVAPAGSIATSVREPGSTSSTEITEKNDGRQLAADVGPSFGHTYIPTGGGDRQTNKDYIAFTDPAKNPVGYYSPTYLNIVNPAYSSDEIKTGSRSFTGATQSIDITGLTPSTKDANGKEVESWYYVYFVLQGNGEVYSTVQCYRVKMGQVEKPHIAISSTGTGANMKPDGDSNLSYVLVELNNLPNFIRSGSISYTENAVGKTMNVLTAMTTQIDGTTGETFFDRYASDNQRNEVSQYIINGTGSIGGGEQRATVSNVRANSTVSRDFETLMTVDKSEYVVLAAAAHPLGGTAGSAYGFAAVRNLYKPDKVNPEYSGAAMIAASISKVTDSTDNPVDYNTWSANPMNYRFSGTVTVTFSKDVYLLIDRERFAVWGTDEQPKKDGEAVADAVSAIEMLGGNTGVSMDRVVARATNSYTFKFEGFGYGSFLRLFDGGDICNADGWSTTKKLVLTFDPTLTAKDLASTGSADVKTPGFRVEWK